jgi:hypothetical protein
MYYFEDPHCQDRIRKFLIDKPLSFLNGDKLNFIIFMIRQHGLQNIFEVGTFAGGTAYLLAKEFPNSQITTIDLNNFEEYFQQWDHRDKILTSLQQGYPEINMQVDSIACIQNIYKSLSPNASFLTGDLKLVDISNCDAIIIDGDHTEHGLLSDLDYCYTNMKPGLIFVDDCVHEHIKRACEDFCSRNSIECKFEVYCNYNDSYSGLDLCVIRKH